MAAFDPATLDRWRALAIVDRDGTTVGTISEFYLDRETGHPTWALITTGIFGATQTFVPLIHATEISDGLQVPYEKSHIKDTPNVDPHDELTPQEEAELFAHYGVEYEPFTEATTAAAEPGSDEGPPDGAEPGAASSPTVAGDEGPGPVRAEAATAGSLAATQAELGSAERTPVTDRENGASPEAVPEEPEPVKHPDQVTSDSPPVGTSVGSGPDGATDAVPDEPGTADPDETPRADGDRSDSERAGWDADRPGAPERVGSDADGSTGLGPDRFRSDRFGSGADHPEPGIDPDDTRSQAANHDPDLGRTAPVEPGLPGSTAAAPYGSAPTVDKTTHRSDASAERPLQVSDETDWPPGASGSFEEQPPFDRPAGASDRWREAKLAAERDRIARANATQPEERSPLERARRRLERLVGGGQDHPDPDEAPADREAAERARRARLGMDDDDRRG
jgi:PRC-barrel domain